MITLKDYGMYLIDGVFTKDAPNLTETERKNAYRGTVSYGILKAHNTAKKTQKGAPLKIRFDALASHDITYVGIIQTAKASGLEKFPLPYVLTNCHNSLCAVGGTINEDDHAFGYSAAKKYGGIFVPPHQAVIHTYMREMMAGAGKMILGSDSHTRYGALGTMAIGEGGPELVKQLLEKTYDVSYPDVVAVNLVGAPRKGVGPQDVALALVKAVFKNGFVKNRIMEFVGSGIQNLPIEYRNGIDVMTTETTCLSSIWATDGETKRYLKERGRAADYKTLKPKKIAYYDRYIEIDLSKVEPMIAFPFHPSNAYTVREVLENPYEILKKVSDEANANLKNPNVKLDLTKNIEDGKIRVNQAIIAGCAGGTYDNIMEAANILKGASVGTRLAMSVYPGSQPVYLDLVKKGAAATLTEAGAVLKTAFCGPCFGAGDVPQNNGLSIRHTTRNFEMREGSKPQEGQIAGVALMDARSIAATARNGGYLAAATDIEYDNTFKRATFDGSVYEKRVYNGYCKADESAELVYGPNIADWPKMIPLTDNLLMKVAAVLNDPVTTTDELIPSGETSSYRSNPLRLAEFALSRKCPDYVSNAKSVYADELKRRDGEMPEEYAEAAKLANLNGTVQIGSVIFAVKPGDGSAREQAASSQRVLGGVANIAKEYATKRYRSNLINWGMLPFLIKDDVSFELGDIVAVKNVKSGLTRGKFTAIIIRKGIKTEIELQMDALTENERKIIEEGCLINYNNRKK